MSITNTMFHCSALHLHFYWILSIACCVDCGGQANPFEGEYFIGKTSSTNCRRTEESSDDPRDTDQSSDRRNVTPGILFGWCYSSIVVNGHRILNCSRTNWNPSRVMFWLFFSTYDNGGEEKKLLLLMDCSPRVFDCGLVLSILDDWLDWWTDSWSL